MRKKTLEKRKTQILHVIELKFDKSHLNNEQKKFLNRLFLEAKWFFNYCVSCNKITDADTKIKRVPIKLNDGSFDERSLEVIAGQMKQEIKARILSNIKTLSIKKRKGNKVGRIRFKTKIESIPLNQYEKKYAHGPTGTHNILVNEGLVTIVKAPKPFKVNGLGQIPKDAEFANANLIHRDGDYFLQVICYTNKDQDYIKEQHEINQNRKGKVIGFDFGCTTQLTGMDNEGNGFKVEFEVPVDKGIRKLDRKIARKLDKKKPKKQRKNSKNRFKDMIKRRKRHQRLNNKKKDIRKKLVSCIIKNYETVIVQDENIKGWQKGGHGKKINTTAIGGIMADLKEKSHTLIVVNRSFASTKTCSKCGFVKDKMEQWERIYVCPKCGAIMGRDPNSAQNMLQEGSKQLKEKDKIAREPSEFNTPGENRTSAASTIETLREIARVSCKPCSLNQEAVHSEGCGSSRVHGQEINQNVQSE